MGQTSRISKNNTKILQPSNAVLQVKLHSTIVVEWDRANNTVKFNSGGWRTVTTKSRMNQAMNEWQLPIGIYQDKGEWYVKANNEAMVFQDGMNVTL